MSTRAIVNVATTEHYRRGQQRLAEALLLHDPSAGRVLFDRLPFNCPSVHQKPYGFKAWAIDVLLKAGKYQQVMWLDSSILPVQGLEPIWQHAAEHGAWIPNNGFTNYEWTADDAYPILFPEWHNDLGRPFSLDSARAVNRTIQHVSSGAFAIDTTHPKGAELLRQFIKLSLFTNVLAGPWRNSLSTKGNPAEVRAAPCGPPDVQGHRHDQTLLSVLAWRLGIPLTDPPRFFAYKGGESCSTCLIADGDY